jgi:hypothetical protein
VYVRKVWWGVSSYLFLLVSHAGQAEWQYATVSIPALVDPARRLPLSAMIVLATPRSARSTICSVGLPSSHVQIGQSVVEVA